MYKKILKPDFEKISKLSLKKHLNKLVSLLPPLISLIPPVLLPHGLRGRRLGCLHACIGGRAGGTNIYMRLATQLWMYTQPPLFLLNVCSVCVCVWRGGVHLKEIEWVVPVVSHLHQMLTRRSAEFLPQDRQGPPDGGEEQNRPEKERHGEERRHGGDPNNTQGRMRRKTRKL